MKNISISLCMIVKNEEKFLKECLESVYQHVDEIIIVDTGSTDGTIKICQDFNAKIYHHEWNNHFADARNVSLSKATSDWILTLDADETLDNDFTTKLNDFLTNTTAHQILFPVKMYYGRNFPTNPDHFYTYYQPRLFRNHVGFRYENRIHEILISTDLSKEIITERIDIPIHHVGYIKEVEIAKEKSERNLSLLKLVEETSEKNPWIAYHLGSEYYRLQNYPLAFDYVNKSIYNFLLLNKKPPAVLYRLKYAILIETNSIEGAWLGIDKVLQLYPDYVDLLFYKGYILYYKKQYSHAKEIFKQCLTLGDDHPSYLTLKGMGSFKASKYIDKCNTKIAK